jgi:hypothetical protein
VLEKCVGMIIIMMTDISSYIKMHSYSHEKGKKADQKSKPLPKLNAIQT